MYSFSKVFLPEQSKPEVWKLQLFLLQEAEKLLGSKEQDKKVYQPTFSDNPDDAPRIMNSASFDGAWAHLSHNSKTYWPCTLYELAHETVHLLNPIAGYTNFLEEGVAVAFSIDMSKSLTEHPMSPIDKNYKRAYELVRLLPGDLYESASKIREHCGSLGKATVESLTELFPSLSYEIIEELCSECNFT
ncbi:hypothetical protein [Vibrio vulnificus]|uniref:hypothetical protein n=1 Tax=Vibrio vulnificus TaxID=672 RepID=UPI00305A8E4B|nr:hypothetical protein [Vibrio vulnificus]EHK8977994.1 hypothetical protein [Vibrio vulnificus]EHK9045952.1 hypothetical protein [Vibrio vulnificus]